MCACVLKVTLRVLKVKRAVPNMADDNKLTIRFSLMGLAVESEAERVLRICIKCGWWSLDG